MFNFIIENQEILITLVATILILLAMYFMIRTSTCNPVMSDESFASLPEGKRIEVVQNVKETRYIVKKNNKQNEDINRFGRWKLTDSNGNSKTRMGTLSNVLTDEIVDYREIK